MNVHDALLTHLSYVCPRRLPPALPARASAFARTGVRLLLTLLTTGGTVWVWLAIAATPAMMAAAAAKTAGSWLRRPRPRALRALPAARVHIHCFIYLLDCLVPRCGLWQTAIDFQRGMR